MKKETTLRNWIANFNNEMYSSNDVETQVDAGWYDWFCKETSLVNKTKRMGNIVKQIKDGGKINLDSTYVWFKNNCQLNGPLYDDFRIAEVESGDVLFTIQNDCRWNEKKFTVFGKKNNFVKPLLETDSLKELIKWFNEGWNE